MKPLPVAPLTYEDLLIWARILKRTVDPGGEGSVLDAWESADRRDAALMLKLCHSSRVLGRPAARVWVIAVAILELEGHLPV